MRSGTAALIVENDLHRRAPASELALGDAVVVDCMETPSAEAAAVVLPAAAYAEQTGAFVNYETRAQRFYQVFEPGDDIAPSWRWISAIATKLGRELTWAHIDELAAACAEGEFAPLAESAPSAGFRAKAHTRIPRQPHRYSGRTAMHAHKSVHEPKASVDDETPLAYSMEGQNVGDQPGAVVPYVWTPGWNSNQSVFKFQQEVGGPLAGGDPGARLLGAAGEPSEEQAVPAGYQPSAGQGARAAQTNGAFVAARKHDIFGSDELSAASAPLLERAPAAHVALNSADARALGVAEGGGVAVAEWNASVEVRVDDSVPSGVAACAQGLPGAPLLATAVVHLQRDADFVRQPTADATLIAKG